MDNSYLDLEETFKVIEEAMDSPAANADQLISAMNRQLKKRGKEKETAFAIKNHPEPEKLLQQLSASFAQPAIPGQRPAGKAAGSAVIPLKKPGKLPEEFRWLKPKDNHTQQVRDIVNDLLGPGKSRQEGLVEALYTAAYEPENDPAGFQSEPYFILPVDLYRKMKTLYHNYRPQDMLVYGTYIISAQSALGCLGFAGGQGAAQRARTLRSRLHGISIMMIPATMALAVMEPYSLTDQEKRSMAVGTASRFIRQLGLDLLYKDTRSFEPDTVLREKIIDLYKTIREDTTLHTRIVFPAEYTSFPGPWIPEVTEQEYEFIIALGWCFAASGRDKIRSKLISIISRCVFDMPPGSLKRISRSVFETLESGSRNGQLNHILAAHCVLECLGESFWLAITSPYVACIRYLCDHIWLDMEVAQARQAHTAQTADEESEAQEDDPNADDSSQNPAETLEDDDDGEEDNIPEDKMAQPSTLADLDVEILLQQISASIQKLPDEPDLDMQLMAARNSVQLLTADIERLTCRLNAFEHRIPEYDTKSSLKENRRLLAENASLMQKTEDLRKELEDLKARRKADKERYIERGHKETQNILYPELITLRRQLTEEQNKHAAFLQDQKELAQLRELIFNDQAENESTLETMQEGLTPAEEEEIRSFFAQNKVVFAGGHIRQSRELEQKYDRFTAAETPTFPPEAVNSADLVIVFAHWISHTTYYKVTNIARRRNIPLEYVNSRNMSVSERELLAIIRKVRAAV